MICSFCGIGEGQADFFANGICVKCYKKQNGRRQLKFMCGEMGLEIDKRVDDLEKRIEKLEKK